ncbi:UBX domain-containing protein 11, partial [Clydaea vesicula]
NLVKSKHLLEPLQLQCKTNLPPLTKSNSLDDLSLVTIMATRLSKLETQLKDCKIEIQKKNEIIEVYEKELNYLKNNGQDYNNLNTKKKKLKDNQHDTKSNSPIPEQTYFKFDVEQLKSKIKELNIISGEGKGYITAEADGNHRLKIPNTLLLRIFKNGFIFRNENFRSFNNQVNRNFIQDILDGYFPYELKDEFPNGNPIELKEDMNKLYQSLSDIIFTGEGYSLANQKKTTSWEENGSEEDEVDVDTDDSEEKIFKISEIPKPSYLNPKQMDFNKKLWIPDNSTIEQEVSDSNNDIKTNEDLVDDDYEDDPSTFVRKEVFESFKNVVEVEKIFNVRKDLTKLKEDGGCKVIRITSEEEAGDKNVKRTSLKVTAPEPEENIYILDVKVSNTIKDIKNLLEPHVGEFKNYIFKSPIQQNQLSYEDYMSLEECGLTNARLYMQRV